MIIQRLSAENLLKYRHIELVDLPERGIIAISGGNEAGKSAIGEIICFALFGRTFAVGPDAHLKLIRWGERYCTVTLWFIVQDGIRYQISRTLEQDKTHTVRLIRTDDPEHPLAQGEAVAVALRRLLGYGFEDFLDAFYLSQRESAPPHPNGHAIQAMAGIVPMTACQQVLAKGLAHDQAALDKIASRTAEAAARLAALNHDGQRAHVLAADQTDLRIREQIIKARHQDLVTRGADYQRRMARHERAAPKHGRTFLTRLLASLGAALGLGGWVLLTWAPAHPLALRLLALLDGRVPPVWLKYAGLACGGVLIFSWLRGVMRGVRHWGLRRYGARLAAALATLDDLEFGLPKGLRSPSAKAPKGETPPQGRLKPEARAHVQQQLQDGILPAAKAGEAVAQESAWLDQVLERLTERLHDLKQEEYRDLDRRQEYERLTDLQGTLRMEEAGLKRHIRLQALAEGLVQGATHHLYQQFNRRLQDLMGHMLPLFTEGRYQHPRIGEELSVRVFSSEKHDVMDLDETSYATQRQIMLALRLSLSQEFIGQVAQDGQFIFLDESFASFDEARTRAALAALPLLSEAMAQIWVVAQTFPDDIAFARRIHCQRAIDHYPANKT